MISIVSKRYGEELLAKTEVGRESFPFIEDLPISPMFHRGSNIQDSAFNVFI